MKKYCAISSYCSITNKGVVVNNHNILNGSGAGFMQLSNDIYSKFAINYPKYHKMDNMCKLGFLTVELLPGIKGISNKYKGEEIGIILMNASSSIDSDRHHQNTLEDRENYFPSPSIFVYTLPNVVIGEICIRHKFYGEGNFFISEKFNPEFMLGHVEQLFNDEAIQCCIAGWVEFDGNDFESLVFLIEKQDKTKTGIVNFEPAAIQSIYEKIK